MVILFNGIKNINFNFINMKKYFDENGKEVKFGDTVSVKEKQTMPNFGEMTIVSSVEFKEGMEDILEASGWITHEDSISINEDVEYYLNKIAKKIYIIEYDKNSQRNYFIGALKEYLKRLNRDYPELVATILAKELAKEFSRMHKDNLFNYDEVWGINKYDLKQTINLGEPTKEMISHLSVFRSCSEAQKAAEIVEKIIKYING